MTTPTQPTLWPDRHTRAAHPDTSRQAAERLSPFATEACLRTARAVRETPGLTAAELEQRHNPDGPEGRIRKRLADCRRAKLVKAGPKRTCEVSGGECLTWWPVTTADPES